MVTNDQMRRFRNGLFRRLVILHMMQLLAFSITGIVDCAVVGREWGENGLAGMKLAMPIFAIMELVGELLASGFSIHVSRLLADGKRKSANQCLVWVVVMAAGLSAALAAAALIIPDTLTRGFAGGGDDEALLDCVKDYLIPITIGGFPIIMHSILSSVVALEGSGKRMGVAMTAVLCSNVLGDLIAVNAGAGVKGVAIASVGAYLIGCLVLSTQFGGEKTIFRPEVPRLEKGLIPAILIAGAPMALVNTCDFICPMLINAIMMKYGNVLGLAALSVQDAAKYMPMAFSEGLGMAVLLLTGIYDAECDITALRDERRSIAKYSFIIGPIWAIALAGLTPIIVKLFSEESSIQGNSETAFLWYLAGVPFITVNFAIRSYLQAKEKEKQAGVFIFLNQLILPVLLALILGHFAGQNGIFASFAVHPLILSAVYIGWQLMRHYSRKGSPYIDNYGEIRAEVRNTISSVEQITAGSENIIDLCLANNVEKKLAYNVGLCLEELALNTLQHGLDKGAHDYMEYRFMITDDLLVLRLRDNGKAFDLTERFKMFNPEDPTKNLGLRIVYGMADSVEYSHTFDLNNICIRVSLK